MKTFSLILLAAAALGVGMANAQVPNNLNSTAPAHHGGGNGGDDLELELKKRALQIGYFVKSDMGSKIFKMLNPDNLVDIVNSTDIDVITGNVTDKYGTLRTCVNEPERALITCNLSRINNLKANKKDDILTAMLFHELLGVMEVELGYQENVSMYPISSKIIPYNNIVATTPISESQIRPEFYGLDSRSYGITYVNKETKESIRMICINNNVEIHRCRNYSIVRNANGIQSPLVENSPFLNKESISSLNLQAANKNDLKEIQLRVSKIQSQGFKYLTVQSETRSGGYPHNRFGAGLVQMVHQDWDTEEMVGVFYTIFPIMYPFWAVDFAVEAPKQALNIVIWPIKSVINLVKISNNKKKLKKLNERTKLMANVLNTEGDLSIVGQTVNLKSEDYKKLTTDLTVILQVLK